MTVVSPVLVGRDTELKALDAALARACAGSGGAVFVRGGAGIGKTRLTTTAARRPGVRVVRGRAGAVPLRAVSEAVFAALRHDGGEPDALGGFGPVLWRLVSDTVPMSDPPLVRAEAVLRLLARVGGPHGCVLLLEDLHEADADTLEIVDYLVDNLTEAPVLLLATLRPDAGPAVDLAEAAHARRAAELLDLAPLDPVRSAELAGHCLGGPVPPAVLDRLLADAEGVPFVLEELVAAMVDDGSLIRSGDDWRVTTGPRTRVPHTVTAAVLQRVDRLPDGVAVVLRAAAVLGRTFALPAAAAAAGVSTEEALRSLRLAAAAQLVGADDGPHAYAFRHALTAEAVLAPLLPTERARLCAAAAAAVEDTDGPERLAADLWAAADEPGRAGALYLVAGRDAARRGALVTAVTLLERGLEGAERAGAPDVVAQLLEELVRAAGTAGDVPRVHALGDRLDALLSSLDAPPQRRVTALLLRTRTGTISGDWEGGLAGIAMARELAATVTDGATRAALTAPIDALAAYLHFLSTRTDRFSTARALATRALAAAEATGQPEIACEALEVLCRCDRDTDLAAAAGHTRRALLIARQHGLAVWQLRAAVEDATIAKERTNDVSALIAVRQAALDAGLIISVAWLDFHLATACIYRGDLDEADRWTAHAAEIGRRQRRPELGLVALATAASTAACRADRAGMERLLAGLGGGAVLGHGAELVSYLRGVCAQFEEDQDRVHVEFVAAEHAYRTDSRLRGIGHRGPYLLSAVTRGDAGWAEYDELAAPPSNLMHIAVHRVYLLWARAVLLGREGRHAEAAATANEARAAGAAMPLTMHLGARVAAPCALADGWGDPLIWLHDAEAWFHAGGHERPAAACRALLRGAGVSRQRRTGHDAIPAALRRAGVTVREYDVLRLLADRLGNIEIGERLFLSPRTVERHVASLRQRTGAPDRAHLVAYARQQLADV